jgi:50S ribosomal subunit-associated GTPase HflX
VDRILTQLQFDQIPRLLVFNKIDLIDRPTLDSMIRHALLESGAEALAISAMDRDSLLLLLHRIDEILAQDVSRSDHVYAAQPRSPLAPPPNK